MEKDLGSIDMYSPPSQAFSSPAMVHLPYHPKPLVDRSMMNPAMSLSMDFSAYRSVSFDRFSSPEAPSPISDQGFFDMTTDDETASCYSPMLLPGKMENHQNGYNKHEAIAMEQLYISGSSSSTPVTTPRKRKTPPSSTHKQSPALEQIMLFSPNATATLTAGPVAMISPSGSSSSSLTMPALSSPLKRHLSILPSSSFSSSDSDNREDEQVQRRRAVFSLTSSCPSGGTKGKNKRGRKTSKKGHDKPKHPPVRLPCKFEGCTTTCSSQPSLARHSEAHKWRGFYAPVRCEACQSALSNEFSVQRHIVRSPPNSRCSRLRVYSIMLSETEIETSVRFYPKRPHGKKTVEVNLEHARIRYLGAPQ
ncbi:hypothetical protein BGZ95_000535 [Linnemannia exigua]|uniref:Uncharacterized protein n=1 Tax=Linnemannia exigua TaxID=604196 RepID=A0AAD4DP34_9FUNG|nr:hypothetical protein BGZ95_000535 [Linnemannia exigua]